MFPAGTRGRGRSPSLRAAGRKYAGWLFVVLCVVPQGVQPKEKGAQRANGTTKTQTKRKVYKMKKFLSLSLALILCMALSIPALAANTETVNDLIITGFSRKETKTVKFLESEAIYDADGYFISSEKVPKDRTITIYYLPVGATISSYSPDTQLNEVNYKLDSDGVFSQRGIAVYESPYTVEEHGWAAESELLNELSAVGSPNIYYIVDTGAAPVQPAEPTTPAEPAQPTETTVPAETAQPAQPATPVAAGSYTVKKGDTYGTIALNDYGTYGVWSELYKANKGAKLTEGATLVLPETLGKVALIAAPAATDGKTLYTVKAGDTLGAIAKATYGDLMKYKAIFERNADRLVNANTIYEGQVIVLPAK